MTAFSSEPNFSPTRVLTSGAGGKSRILTVQSEQVRTAR
jgi:hypothetical protein